jgi:hypothetical protein
MDTFLVAFPRGLHCRADDDEDGNGKCKIKCYTEEQHVNLQQLLLVPVDEGAAFLAHIHSEYGDQADDHERECDCFHINLQLMQSKKSSEE